MRKRFFFVSAYAKDIVSAYALITLKHVGKCYYLIVSVYA